MLLSLSVSNLLLIDKLDLELQTSLCALTGETGTGKSILLDALGLALGSRAETGFIRPGAEHAHVTAEFDIDGNHPAIITTREQGLDIQDTLILRRILSRDGKNRATINDQPVSVNFLKKIGSLLVEIQGQSDNHGLLDVNTHISFLDDYSKSNSLAGEVSLAWGALRDAKSSVILAKKEMNIAETDEPYLRHVLEELQGLMPGPNEEEALITERKKLRGAEKIGEALQHAQKALSTGETPVEKLVFAERAISRVANEAGEDVAQLLKVLSMAVAETQEADSLLSEVINKLSPNPERLDDVESRLFLLKSVARKHDCDISSLPEVHDNLLIKLKHIDSQTEHFSSLVKSENAARDNYVSLANKLSKERYKTAAIFDKAINKELKPLRLNKATFQTIIEPLEESRWNRSGIDKVRFEVQTNIGHKPGPLNRVASGGELARFLLALRVVLAQSQLTPVLIFDEVDRGIGGATANAVGERLYELGKGGQVLVVTHSPQVAARAQHHWKIEKHDSSNASVTKIMKLDKDSRREEVARMLSGAEVTDEARAAAQKLISGTNS